MSKHIIIDTDPGIDDALAFLLAVASPELILDGITTIHGNASTSTTRCVAVPRAAGLVGPVSVMPVRMR